MGFPGPRGVKGDEGKRGAGGETEIIYLIIKV